MLYTYYLKVTAEHTQLELDEMNTDGINTSMDDYDDCENDEDDELPPLVPIIPNSPDETQDERVLRQLDEVVQETRKRNLARQLNDDSYSDMPPLISINGTMKGMVTVLDPDNKQASYREFFSEEDMDDYLRKVD
jgi:hypothetical protein